MGWYIEAIRLSSDGTPVVGLVVFVLFVMAAVWDAVSPCASRWAWCEPLGVLITGIGIMCLLPVASWVIFIGLGLIAACGYVIKGYRWAYLPRSTSKKPELPPL